MGIMTFAFGMGGAVAAFAGLLHMTVHSLTKSAIFFTVATPPGDRDAGHGLDRGLVQIARTIGWAWSSAASRSWNAPFGVFTSEFMVLTTAMHEHSWATPILLVALGVALRPSSGKVQPMVFGEPRRSPSSTDPPSCRCSRTSRSCWLSAVHPPYLVGWYRRPRRS